VTAGFRLEVLGTAHDRRGFECGVEPLDRYFREYVTQDVRRRITNCFVTVEAESGRVAAYYTLAASSLSFADLPVDEAKRLPRYPVLPAVLIGRLAVDRQFHRRGLGGALLADAAWRAIRAEPAVFTLLVDAKDENAEAFYRRHGFKVLPSNQSRLWLPVATATKVLAPPR
jgi:ribosomal protein S18 acetylase RimI-like enzyme